MWKQIFAQPAWQAFGRGKAKEGKASERGMKARWVNGLTGKL